MKKRWNKQFLDMFLSNRVKSNLGSCIYCIVFDVSNRFVDYYTALYSMSLCVFETTIGFKPTKDPQDVCVVQACIRRLFVFLLNFG